MDCGNISAHVYGDVICTGTTYGETCHLTCHDGYERLSRDNFTCQVHGDKPTWSGEPECIPVSCGAPPEFPNTSIQRASGHTYGNTCGVTCADGYERTNLQIVTCHSTGNWSLQAGAFQPVVGGPDLFCRKKDCGNLPTPAHGSLTCSGTRYQDSCRLTCEPGYKVADESGHLLHCLYNFRCTASGQWNERPSCVPSDYCQLGLHDCHPEHGVCSLTGHQAFSCRCRVGTAGNGTHCERTSCPDFPIAEPENGFFTCSIPGSSAVSTMEYEVVCVLHCNHGYDRLIYAEYSCGQDGNWTIPLDINSTGTKPCLAVKCPDLSSPQHGRMTCDSGYSFRYPEICRFACDVHPGYELTSTSSSVRRCQADATWSGNDAECIGVQCPALSNPTNGRMSCNNGSSFRHPETCTFSCNHGYQLSAGSTSRTCQADRTWSGSAARCVAECPSVTSPQNGRVTCNNHLENGRCTFTCNHGYHLLGSSQVVCGADGRWIGTLPSCAACDSAADIIFSIDVSGSVSGHFDTVRNFINGVVNSLTIGRSHARVGLIKFAGSHAETYISLTDFDNKYKLVSAISSVFDHYSSGEFSIAGLSVMGHEFSTNGRSAARKIGIVLTDGQDSGSGYVIPDATALRNDGTTIFCVGVADVRRETLDNMASRPVNEHVFTASFDNLQTIVDTLRPKVWC
ncbi:P-selectin-like [Branchiostoma floridae x Branchiostoma japonicum]